jgi:hypothetical protein
MRKCGSPTTVAGKFRICERRMSHSGRHMTSVGGKYRFWKTTKA